MSTQFKAAKRLYLRHISRFITIICIVIVSIGFMSGVGEVENKIHASNNYYYQQNNLFDLNIKCKNPTGFTPDEIAVIKDEYGKDNVYESLCYDIADENDIITRYHYYNLEDDINKFKILDGSFPSKPTEVLVERPTIHIISYEIGDEITINGINYTVSGIIFNPIYTYEEMEPSLLGEDKYLSNIIYINTSFLPIKTDLYITLKDREVFDSFSEEYEELIEDEKNKIKTILNPENVEILTLYENIGLYGFNYYGDKISTIGIIFVVFFLLVTLLVVYSTMTRLLDEERGQIACQKTLGYSNRKIIRKYSIFVFMATLIGGLLSFKVGNLLTKLIYNGMKAHYYSGPYASNTNYLYYIVVFAIMVLATYIMTFITGMKVTNKKPVVLLTPKVAKVGHTVLTERIKFIWNRLSFRYKSTIRNVFLFKSRLLMTVISITGSSVLVLAGIALLDNTKYEKLDSPAIKLIALTVIIFSAALSLLVIYNITNINISERNREIATLLVLGYRKNEVTGYIFREIYIMSWIGALFGLPFGAIFLSFVFDMIDFGSFKGMNWWTWILAPLITMLFTFLSTLILRGKILKVDMNESLKTNE